MNNLINMSKERRIEKRRNRIRNKLNRERDVTDKRENEATDDTKVTDNDEDNIILYKDENQLVYTFEYKNIECDLNYDNLRKEIITNLDEKKNYYIKELSTKINKEEKPFLENIKKYAIELPDNHFMIHYDEKTEKLSEELKNTNKTDYQNDVKEVNNLAIKENETYKKKIEKYVCLLKYKDEKIKKLCQTNSKNLSSFISFVRNQMEGYKIYLEDIFNKTRDSLNLKRQCLLNNNKQILEDFLRMQNLNSNSFIDELKNEKILNEKIKESHEHNNLNLKIKNELLEKNLNTNIEYIEDINNTIMNKEKNAYKGKLLQQKNAHNLKMINFYKLEINKLRESLLSVKTYYYNYKIKSKKNITELINQYERIKFQFIELQKRQKNYELNFQKRYSKAWELQKSETKKCIEKLVNVNQIIYEKILQKTFHKTDYDHLIEENTNLTSTPVKDNEKSKTCANNKKVSDEQMENVKKLLLQECNFIVDDNIKDDKEKLKAILKYIGIHSQRDLELLTQLFYIDEEEEDEEEDESKKKEKKKCNNAEYALDIIFKYYQEKEKENLCRTTENKQKYKNRLDTSLELVIVRRKKEKEYWDNLSRIASDDMIELWKTFLIFVEKYYHILRERANIIKNIFIEDKLVKENLNKINKLNYSIKKL